MYMCIYGKAAKDRLADGQTIDILTDWNKAIDIGSDRKTDGQINRLKLLV